MENVYTTMLPKKVQFLSISIILVMLVGLIALPPLVKSSFALPWPGCQIKYQGFQTQIDPVTGKTQIRTCHDIEGCDDPSHNIATWCGPWQDYGPQ